MASATRIEIIHVLRDGPKRVTDIARATGHPQSTISHHFAVLRNAGIVTARRRGLQTLYQITNPKIAHICDLMREVLAEEAARHSLAIRGPEDEHPR
ncbi:MAG TPA: metalloregulator ArsR/SmtB family transcription factor [Acidimicrobiia bacterium]|nr:metalloregulator ArsR/SmtB family transcription factor [Acidimicrobiia bacterium]